MYGIRKPLKSWNPIWTNFHFYAQLAKDAWHTERWQDKLTIWFRPTGWRPEDMEKRFPLAKFDASTFKKFDINMPALTIWYSLLQHIIIVAVVYLYMKNITGMNMTEQLSGGAFIIVSLLSIGGLLEGRQWALWLEYLRYFVLLLVAYQLSLPNHVFIILAAISLLSFSLVSFIKPLKADTVQVKAE